MIRIPLYAALLLSTAMPALAEVTGPGNRADEIVIQLPATAPRPRGLVQGDSYGEVFVRGRDFGR
jgi:hypothetical protein